MAVAAPALAVILRRHSHFLANLREGSCVYAEREPTNSVTIMPESATNAAFPAYIDVNNPQDVTRWAKEFGLSEEQLRAIIQIVGNSVSAVQGEIATE